MSQKEYLSPSRKFKLCKLNNENLEHFIRQISSIVKKEGNSYMTAHLDFDKYSSSTETKKFKKIGKLKKNTSYEGPSSVSEISVYAYGREHVSVYDFYGDLIIPECTIKYKYKHILSVEKTNDVWSAHMIGEKELQFNPVKLERILMEYS